MKSTAIIAGLAVAAVFVFRSFRGRSKGELSEEKIHELQDHFRRLDDGLLEISVESRL